MSKLTKRIHKQYLSEDSEDEGLYIFNDFTAAWKALKVAEKVLKLLIETQSGAKTFENFYNRADPYLGTAAANLKDALEESCDDSSKEKP